MKIVPFVAFALLLAVASPAASDVGGPAVPEPAVAIEQATLDSVSGCQNGYTVYRPARPATELTVMTVPGFMRGRDRMRGWAEEISSRGITAVTMDFCQPTAFDGRHRENARDMIAVRRALGATRIVYVGHSAGGLASLLAAADDPAARGLVLLDPVDFGDLAGDAALRAAVPVLVLLARPGVCNLGGNIRDTLPRFAHATTISIPAASHCDFEWPPDGLCRMACDFGGPGREKRIASEQRIRWLALGFIDTLRAVVDDTPGDRRHDAQ